MRRIVGRITSQGYQSEADTVSQLDDMLASRKGPGLVTDTALFQGLGTTDPYEGLQENVKQYYRHKALKAGVNPDGKRYCGSLALEPGDPRALVESRGDMLRLAQERNMNVEGIVTNKVDQNAEGKTVYDPAWDILEDRTIEILTDQGAEDTVTRKEWDDAETKAYNQLVR